jgi:hypothetical protein
MAECECLPKCPFFNDKMETLPAIANMYRRMFCKGDNSGCARYQIFTTLGRDKVPADLYPNMVERADELIRQYSH